eukprot:15436809-Alexandrium_andersonii.AAC.1
MARCPKCNPQSAQCPSVLQSASTGSPRSKHPTSLQAFGLNCAGPRRASEWVPEAPEGCILRRFSRRFRIRARSHGSIG